MINSKWQQKKSPKLVARAKELEEAGESWRSIAKILGVSKGTIRNWLHPDYQTDEHKKRRNRIRQDRRNHKYNTNPLYRIKQILRVAKAKADRCGYKSCITDPEEILESVTDTCECCRRHESECGTLCIDHWHDEPAVFRAWLCHDCNRAIGLMQDDCNILERAAELLRKSDAKRKIQRSD